MSATSKVSEETSDDFGRYNKWFLYGIAIVVFVWVITACIPLLSFWAFARRPSADVENIKGVLQQYGTFGDMFGAFNALVNGFTLLGVAYAVVLQHHEMRGQRTEIAKLEKNAAEQRALHSVAMYIEILNGLCHYYHSEYSSDRAKYDNEYELITNDKTLSPDDRRRKTNECVSVKLRKYRRYLEIFSETYMNVTEQSMMGLAELDLAEFYKAAKAKIKP